jgi:two-component system OmpR family response regulator
MRALVVDDDRKISSFVEKGLREAGFAVDTVANGPDALNLARTTPSPGLLFSCVHNSSVDLETPN